MPPRPSFWRISNFPSLLEAGAIIPASSFPLEPPAGEKEPLLELTTKAPLDFVRLAWHIGNRHTDVQFTGAALRIRRDHVLEVMVKGLGARVGEIEAPFDPEPAAPRGHAHDHD